LEATLQEARNLAAAGGQDSFGRSFADKPALQPPYYAIKVTGALFHTQGGLVVNERAQVLDRSQKPVPRLYAGGGAACGLSGNHVWGYLSGNGLLSAIVLGRVAGDNAARRLRR
jgi:fumarate reductase flavoprotein subunit